MRIESWHCGAPIGPIAIILFPIVLGIAAADIKDASGHLHRLQSDLIFARPWRFSTPTVTAVAWHVTTMVTASAKPP